MIYSYALYKNKWLRLSNAMPVKRQLKGMVGGSMKTVLPTWRHRLSRGEKDEGEEKKQSRSITTGIT